MTTRRDPIQPADGDALTLVRQLLSLGHAALAWEDPDTGTPGISRIAFARDPQAGMNWPLCFSLTAQTMQEAPASKPSI